MWSERFTLWSIVALLIFTPLAFGAVHPWAYIVMESVIFLAVGGWLISHRWNLQPRSETLLAPLSASVRRLVLPLVLFLGFLFFQLLPLPPLVLQTLSPATYDLYVRTLPGWPETVPHAGLTHQTEQADLAKQAHNNAPAVWTVLQTLDEVDKTSADQRGETLNPETLSQTLSDDHSQRT